MPKLSLLLLTALAAACTTAGPAPAPAPAPPPSGPVAATDGFPRVAYTTTIVAADVPATASAEERAGIIGSWVINFRSDGHAIVTYNGRQVVDAPYQVNGTELLLTEDTGEYACHSNARYRWPATATELHLIKVEDSCDGRVVALTAHALVRQ